ncbi:hypothetical protein RUMGNA_03641 [Mediterraneibacter gnavus ATCC 29149]|uniref:Uncharacterized protein n=1 Tax=Mediterraneibacter gnavus (strain ATCC 29149 / DSM 114966 / JCM 6515 / VPI C7-9) TaxID=411470 RepID=A7B7S5_MEDG7|nr:hypothetical protein RUMGNA_03641 [Mediterraneibacter gnavus ATCC 29149]
MFFSIFIILGFFRNFNLLSFLFTPIPRLSIRNRNKNCFFCRIPIK